MTGIIVAEVEFLGFNSEFGLGKGGGCNSLSIGHSLSKMPWVFAEINFSVHAGCDLLVVNLLLDVEFGKFGRSESVGGFFCFFQHCLL